MTPLEITMTEAQLDEAIAEMANLFGFLRYHTFDSRKSTSGFPDLVLVRAPRLIFAELKSDKGPLRPEQGLWLDRLSRCTHEVYLWRPRDWIDGTIEGILRPGPPRRNQPLPFDPDPGLIAEIESGQKGAH